MESSACSSRAGQVRGRLQITQAEDGGQGGPSARLVGGLGQMARPHGNVATEVNGPGGHGRDWVGGNPPSYTDTNKAYARESAQIPGNDRLNQVLGPGSRIGHRTGFIGHAGPPALLRPMSPSNVSQVYHEVIEN